MRKFVVAAAFAACIMQVSAQGFGSPAMRKLQMAELAIANLYVDPVDEDKLVEEAIVKMLAQLDPHSTYSDADEVKKMNEPLQGNFEGIGVQFNISEDTLFVIQPVSGGPSEKAGILAGDRIVMVNDTSIAGVKMSTEEIMRRLRGPKDSKVGLKVLRRGVSELLPFTVKRDRIPIYSLDASYLIKDKTGYIKINRFGATTPKEFAEAFRKLKQEGMQDLILDLQGNGGGYLNAAVELANEFLDADELIVYTEGRKSPRSEYKARGNGAFRTGRLVVLVDDYSASASEILAGAVQDWDRGIVVGRRSFGKGLVQRPVDLPDGSMIRLTVARYYTPAGRSIQKPYDNAKEYSQDLINRYNKGEMTNADSIHFPDSLKYATKKLGRIVYGGGGIMPDYFVPLDTTIYTKYHRKLVNQGIVNKANMKYIEKNRKALLAKYRSFDDFDKHFDVSEAMLAQLVDLGNEAKIEYDEEEYQKSLPLLKIQLKALVARDLWDMNEYFRIINATNESVAKALELLDSPDFDGLLRKKQQPLPSPQKAGSKVVY